MKKYLMLAIASLVGLWAHSVPAAVIVTLDAVVPDGSNWDWVYRAELQSGETLSNGDFFGIYDVQSFFSRDFGGLGGNFAITQKPFGNANTNVPVGSETSATNIFVRYTGATPIVADASGGPISLGDLIVRSTSSIHAPSFFTSLSSNTASSAPVNEAGPVDVPAAVPEPGSLIVTFAGLLAAGVIGWRRRSTV